MSHETKIEEELRYVEIFSGLRPDLRISDLRASTDPPDFACTIDGMKVAIEVTRFFLPSNDPFTPQAMDAYRQRMATMLCDLHAKIGLPPSHISVRLSVEDNLRFLDSRKLLAEQLVDFVADHISDCAGYVEFPPWSVPKHLVDAGVNSIAILRNDALTKGYWVFPHAAFIPESRSSSVQEIVTRKSGDTHKYAKSCDSLWLLIVSGSGGLHSMIDFDGDVLTTEYVTTFDRIFLLRTFGTVHELKTSKP